MRLTKWTHACVQLEVEGGEFLIDPGVFTPPRAELLETADVVLVTHDHFDHVDVEAVATAARRRRDLRVLGPASVIRALRAADAPDAGLTEVGGGETLDLDGIEVRCVGGAHAVIHDGIEVPYNVGYLVGAEVFHPGDSYRVPEPEVAASIGTLLTPISGPWVKLGEAIDFIRAVAPRRTVAVHEAMLSELGTSSAERFLGEGGLTATPMQLLAPGESSEL